MKPRILLLGCVAVGAAISARVLFAAPAHLNRSPGASSREAGAMLAPGGPGRFRFLAQQTSNRCDLSPVALRRMAARLRLQGSCCSSMDFASYRLQVCALRTYRAIRAIPADPYDIPVSLAKRLLAYDTAIRLAPAQARMYRQAMRLSSEKGPCCCHCWRWEAFAGLSKHLIAQQLWGARQVARVIDLIDGCGGRVQLA